MVFDVELLIDVPMMMRDEPDVRRIFRPGIADVSFSENSVNALQANIDDEKKSSQGAYIRCCVDDR